MFTTVSMGLRQIYAYLIQFPRVEKCGIHGVWSQSRTNPTKEIDVMLYLYILSHQVFKKNLSKNFRLP